MKRTLALGTTSVLVAAACAGLNVEPRESALPRRPGPGDVGIGQVSFGAEAQFVLCPGGACSRPTPKTPAAVPSATAPATTPLANVGSARALPASSAIASPSGTSTDGDNGVSAPLTLTFAPGASVLTPEMLQRLEQALPTARAAQRIVIRGRTDSTGAAPVNQRVALSRATSVREYFVANNVSAPHLVKLDARGRCCYVSDNATEAGRAQNRRVEIEFEPRPAERAAS